MSDDAANQAERKVAAPASTIVCVDCGGFAHIITPPRDDNDWFEGDVASYRCADCRDRWDIVLE